MYNRGDQMNTYGLSRERYEELRPINWECGCGFNPITGAEWSCTDHWLEELDKEVE